MVSRWWMVCAVCSAPSLSTPAQSEPPPPSDSANQLLPNNGCEQVDLILVGCVKSKHHRAGYARDIYTSPLWEGRRAYAELHGCPWYILSAKHGLLAPGAWIEPYDLSLASVSTTKRREWSLAVLYALVAQIPTLDGKTIEVHAGKHYVDFGLEKGLRDTGAVVRRPLAHVVGTGSHIAWYREHMASCHRGS